MKLKLNEKYNEEENLQMENYKNKIKRRIIALYIAEAILFILVILTLTIKKEMRDIGTLAPIIILIAVGINRYRKLVKDEKLLKISYNKANDERRKAILAKAGLPLVGYMSLAILIAAFILFSLTSNYTIFITLYIVALSQIAISAIMKIVYLKKM